MRGERWIVEDTGETLQELNESYRILTEKYVQEHDGKPERVWIADVYEWGDAIHIVELHNAALENVDGTN